MNKCIVVLITVLILSLSLSGASQAAESKYRLGVQGSNFVTGLSGVMEISTPWALQGILDFGVDVLALRALNRFHKDRFWNAYGLGAVAIRDNGVHDNWRNNWPNNSDEIGLGLGLGVEYDWRGLNATLPPLGWNLELGAMLVPDFDLNLNVGVHWKF